MKFIKHINFKVKNLSHKNIYIGRALYYLTKGIKIVYSVNGSSLFSPIRLHVVNNILYKTA